VSLEVGININTITKEVHLLGSDTHVFEGTPQQIIFNFVDAYGVSSVFNQTSGDVTINSGDSGGGPYYVDYLAISTSSIFGYKATLSTFSASTSLVNKQPTLIFKFKDNNVNLTSLTLANVTYQGNNIPFKITGLE
jgi:hypothetical protein